MQHFIRVSLGVEDLTKLGEISLSVDGFNVNKTIQRLICQEWSRLTLLAPDRAGSEHGDDPGESRAAGEANR